jgi:hypothetical protein
MEQQRKQKVLPYVSTVCLKALPRYKGLSDLGDVSDATKQTLIPRAIIQVPSSVDFIQSWVPYTT